MPCGAKEGMTTTGLMLTTEGTFTKAELTIVGSPLVEAHALLPPLPPKTGPYAMYNMTQYFNLAIEAVVQLYKLKNNKFRDMCIRVVISALSTEEYRLVAWFVIKQCMCEPAVEEFVKAFGKLAVDTTSTTTYGVMPLDGLAADMLIDNCANMSLADLPTRFTETTDDAYICVVAMLELMQFTLVKLKLTNAVEQFAGAVKSIGDIIGALKYTLPDAAFDIDTVYTGRQFWALGRMKDGVRCGGLFASAQLSYDMCMNNDDKVRMPASTVGISAFFFNSANYWNRKHQYRQISEIL